MKRTFLYVLITAALLALCCVSAFAATYEELGYTAAPDQTICRACGDVNDDGQITAADARLVLRFSVGLEKFKPAVVQTADVDGDGRVNSSDARVLLRYSVGLESGFRHTKAETVVFETATCFSSGSCADLCAHCGKLFNFGKVPQTEHFAAGWDTLEEATCAREGLCELRCIFCDTIMETRLIDKTKHDFGETQYETAPDCFHYVNTYRVCSVCGFTERSTEAPAGEHTFYWETIKEATCTEDGLAKEVCTHCGFESGKTQAIKCVGSHTIADWRTVKYATCTSDGQRTKTCRRCKEVYDTEIIPALGHDMEPDSYRVITAPTCTGDGVAEYECLTCLQTVTEILPAAGHKPSGEPVTAAPTCTEAGSSVYTCSVCEKEITLVLPAKGHTPGEWEFAELEDGNYFIRKCVVCGEEIERSERFD